MSAKFIFHNVSGDENNCFYFTMHKALVHAELWDALEDGKCTRDNAVACLRNHVAQMVRTHPRAFEIIKQKLREPMEASTAIEAYTSEQQDWRSHTTDQSVLFIANVIQSRPVMAEALEFSMMDLWLERSGIKLVNMTESNAKERHDILALAKRYQQPYYNSVSRFIIVSTDNRHYNWVTVEYRGSRGFQTSVIVPIDTLVFLLSAEDNTLVQSRGINGSHISGSVMYE